MSDVKPVDLSFIVDPLIPFRDHLGKYHEGIYTMHSQIATQFDLDYSRKGSVEHNEYNDSGAVQPRRVSEIFVGEHNILGLVESHEGYIKPTIRGGYGFGHATYLRGVINIPKTLADMLNARLRDSGYDTFRKEFVGDRQWTQAGLNMTNLARFDLMKPDGTINPDGFLDVNYVWALKTEYKMSRSLSAIDDRLKIEDLIIQALEGMEQRILKLSPSPPRQIQERPTVRYEPPSEAIEAEVVSDDEQLPTNQLVRREADTQPASQVDQIPKPRKKGLFNW